MIVRPHPSGWRITLHPAHGLLAAELFRQLPNRVPDALYLPTLLAVAQHDDHQLNFETGDYLTELGAPKDFTLLEMDSDQRSLQAENLLREAYRKHLWTGLLIGKHLEFLYDGQAVDSRLKKLLTGIRKRRKTALKAHDWAAEQLDTAYGQLRFCDRLSLILCGEELPSLGRKLEINDALSVATYLHQEEQDETIGIDPWPFVTDEFTVSVESHPIDRLSFSSTATLGKFLESRTTEIRSWTFRR